MEIMVKNEDMAQLLDCISVVQEKLSDTLHYLHQACNRIELMVLRNQAESCYQNWVNLKDTDHNTAAAVYLEYIELQNKIYQIELQIEIPF